MVRNKFISNYFVMKKILLFTTIFILFWINTTFWLYYENHWISYSNPWATWLSIGTAAQGYSAPSWPNNWTFCDDDVDWIDDSGNNMVALNNSAATLVPHDDSEVWITPSWTLTLNCLYWDWEIPTVTDDYAFDNIWTNWASKTITLTPLDTGGSWISTTKWCEWVACNPSTWNVWTSITKLANYDNTIR